MSKKYLLTVSACSLLILSSCSQMNMASTSQDMQNASGVQAKTSEDLLAAEGSWNLVEDRAVNAPMDLHSSAKKRVNPNNRQKTQFVPKSQLANVAGTNGQEDMRFRLLRMEREMADLRQDFDRLLPPLSNLIVADQELDNTIQGIMAKPQKKPDMQSSKAMAPKPKAMPKKVMASSTGDAAVKQIRFGEHPGKTRMVLDLTGAAKYRADVDNNEKLLLVELSGADWKTTQQKLIKHPLVAGYSAQASSSGGTTLALELKKPVRILGSAALKPNSTRGHRIYLDLAAG